MFSENCDVCHGRKVVLEKKVLVIEIEKGMKDGEMIVFKGESEQHPGMAPGDLVVQLKQQYHNVFHTRNGDDLYLDVHLDLKVNEQN